MTKGYVVTYSDQAPHIRGEFWYPVVYKDIDVAIDAVNSCMHNKGGKEIFKISDKKDSDIVVTQWNSNTTRIWLEELEICYEDK